MTRDVHNKKNIWVRDSEIYETTNNAKMYVNIDGVKQPRDYHMITTSLMT